jgi:hypothetical protein
MHFYLSSRKKVDEFKALFRQKSFKTKLIYFWTSSHSTKKLLWNFHELLVLLSFTEGFIPGVVAQGHFPSQLRMKRLYSLFYEKRRKKRTQNVAITNASHYV